MSGKPGMKSALLDELPARYSEHFLPGMDGSRQGSKGAECAPEAVTGRLGTMLPQAAHDPQLSHSSNRSVSGY